MGRPKAIRNRDTVPTIDLSAAKKAKHKSFEEDEEIEENSETIVDNSDADNINSVAITPVASNKRKKDKKEKDTAIVSNTDGTKVDDAAEAVPEEVRLDTDEILKLKELHERIIVKPRKKKVKKIAQQAVPTDKELDSSILDAFDDDNKVEDEMEADSDGSVDNSEAVSNEEENDFTESDSEEEDRNAISKKKNSTKIVILSEDNTMEKDPLASFPLSQAVLDFDNLPFNTANRISYSAFANQKRARPAKVFATGNF